MRQFDHDFKKFLIEGDPQVEDVAFLRGCPEEKDRNRKKGEQK
jgi:hypothetical protein